MQAIDAATAAYINAMSAKPAAAEIIMLDNAIKSIKACGAWTALDGLVFLATGTDQGSRINARQPGVYDLVKINSPRFIAGQGWDSNNGAGYLDTGFNPATAAGRFTRNSACMGVSVSATAATNPAIGNTGTGNSFVTPVTVSNTFAGRLNSAGSSSSANTDIGLYAVARVSASVIRLFKNGNQVLNASVPTTTPASANIGILSENGGGRYAIGVRVTFAWWGGNLTGRQVMEMQKIYAAYAAFYGIAT